MRRKLVSKDKQNPRLQRDLAISLNFLGDVKGAVGDHNGALAAYNEGLGIVRLLATQHRVQRDLAATLDHIGDVKLWNGDRLGAIAAYQESLTILRSLVALDPESVQAKTDLVIALTKFAANADEPAPLFREALDILRALDGTGKLTAEQKSWIGMISAQLGDAAPK